MACSDNSWLRITRIIIHHHRSFAAVFNPSFAGENIVRDHGAPNTFSELDLRFVLVELAATDADRSTFDLQRVAALFLVVPLDERAVAETHNAFTGDFCDLVARPPKGTVHKTNAAGMARFDTHHRRVGTVEGDEFTI